MWNCILDNSGLLEAYLKKQWWAGKRLHYSCDGRIEKSVPQDHLCYHSASLVMPNGDPQDGFFYPTHTLMIDSYIPFPKTMFRLQNGRLLDKSG